MSGTRPWPAPGSYRRLNFNLVVHGGGDSLDTAEIALRRLDRDMAEQELNLLKFDSGSPA